MNRNPPYGVPKATENGTRYGLTITKGAYHPNRNTHQEMTT